MSRIRSLHPGLFTDERYMALSFPARELIKGVWCEADDQGAFEWKPLTLKARIMPADAVNISELLDELIAGEFIIRYEIEGRNYGAVRNFRKYQRPKKPNASHLLPPDLRTYVGLTDDNPEPSDDESPPVPHQFPTEGGKPPQMEDEGRRKKDSDASASGAAAPADPVKAVFDRGVAVYAAAGLSEKQARALIGKQRQEFGETAVLAALASCEREVVSEPVSYVAACLQRAGERKTYRSASRYEGGVIPMHPGAGG